MNASKYLQLVFLLLQIRFSVGALVTTDTTGMTGGLERASTSSSSGGGSRNKDRDRDSARAVKPKTFERFERRTHFS